MAEQSKWQKLADLTCKRIFESRARSAERYYRDILPKLMRDKRPPIIDEIARVRAEG